MLPSREFALQSRGAQRAGEVHTRLPAAPERVIGEHADGRALLRVEGAREGPVAAAALDAVVGRVGDVVVDELPHLHHQHRVVRVRRVVLPDQRVAHLPGGRKLDVPCCKKEIKLIVDIKIKEP